MNEIIDKSTRFSQVCQLLLSLIVFGGHAPKFTKFFYQLGLMVFLKSNWDEHLLEILFMLRM